MSSTGYNNIMFMGGISNPGLEHSVYFNNKNSFTDWHLIPDGIPVIAQPELKTNMVEIPGGQGMLDLSEALTGYPLYKHRTGELKFLVIPGAASDWPSLLQDMAATIHGRTITITLKDDPDWYYTGRTTLSYDMQNGSPISVTVGYELDPFKYSATLNRTTFSFTTSGTKTYTVLSATQKTFPVTPYVSISTMNASSLLVKMSNPELKITTATKYQESIGISGDRSIYQQPVSNMSGKNTVSVTITCSGLPSGKTQNADFVFRRAML